MGFEQKINFFTPKTTTFNSFTANQPKAPVHQQQAQTSAPAEKTHLTADMSELEVKAEMNKAMGFVKQTPANNGTDYAAIDKQFAKDPLGFAARYTSPDSLKSIQASTAEFDAAGTLLRTMSPERQAQVVDGFSQRNNSPRSFTGEFLDMFAVAS